MGTSSTNGGCGGGFHMAQVRELLFPSDDPSEEISALSYGVTTKLITTSLRPGPGIMVYLGEIIPKWP